MRRCVVVTLLLLLIVVAIASNTEIDFVLSDLVFDETTASWPVSHDHSWLRVALYEGAKYLVVAISLFFMAGTARPQLFRSMAISRRDAGHVTLCILVVPIVVGLIKYSSNVACPIDLTRYGGSLPDVLGHFSISRVFSTPRFSGCWPSGHSSGGFALMALACLSHSALRRKLLWLGAAIFGGAMGAYQVARGAHFVSHIVVTALIAQFFVCLFAGTVLTRGMSINSSGQ